MTIDQIRKIHRSKPFQAFRVHLADGRSFDITHPEVLAINEPRCTVVIAVGNAFESVDPMLVTSLEVLNGRTKAGKRKS